MASTITNTVNQYHIFVFNTEVRERNYAYLEHEGWEAEIDHTKVSLPEGMTPILWKRGKFESNIVFSGEGFVGILNIDATDVFVQICQAEPENNSKEIIQQFKDMLPPIGEPEENFIHVKFWYHTTMGPQVVTRMLDAPKWDEIQDNYSSQTQKMLNKLMFNFKPTRGGQLILFTGQPGLGKTFSIRSLAQAWKPWVTVDYIVDPEQFFGSASYLMQILSSQHEGEEIEWDDGGRPIISPDKTQEKWKLLILEDAGEFLSIDAKNNTGQALSRLLNVADGFIGQGLKILTLITTNEDIERFHEAIIRPGRSAAIVPFTKLTKAEAKSWMKDKNALWTPTKNDYSLAELYSISEEFGIRAEEAPRKEFGFGRI